MKIWVDDVRPAPDGHIHIRTVNRAIQTIETREKERQRIIEIQEAACEDGRDEYAQYLDRILHSAYSTIELIDIDHDAGNYASEGGDYIKLLDWLEETGRDYPIHIHSQNVVGVENMRRIIKRNGWREV